jgi:kynurenine formamidase
MSSYIDELRAVLGTAEIIDLSHTMETGMPAWPTQARYGSVTYEHYDYGDESVHSQVTFSEHSGTHVDAPMHFVRGGATVDELPPDVLVGRLMTIDASHLAPNELLPVAFVERWEAANGVLEAGDIVCIRFGWDEKWALQPNTAEFLRDWPGLAEDGARYLLHRGVKAVGTDAASIDPLDVPPGATANPCHRLLLGAGVPLLENVANLRSLPPVSFAVGLPLKLRGGSASPIRLLAIVGSDD